MSGGLILIVDDNSMNSKIASFALTKGGYDTISADSGAAALELIKTQTPDLILLDVLMPEMSGFDVIARLKENEVYKDIPVIFLTGDSDRSTEVECFVKGAQDFITKPFAADVVIQRVGRTLELNRLQKHMQTEVEKQTKIAQERFAIIEKLTDEVITAMASAIDAKDKYTNGHSIRVAKYSLMIAERLGKTENEKYTLHCAATLHDVGKIGVADEIINKTSKLNDEEYEKIKAHTVIGADILKNITQITEIATGAMYHHERYDGKGYPSGLKGNEIPEIARIICVADAYDAMSSSRSYRPLCKQEYIREQILAGLGTQFDPVFSQCMLNIIDEDKEFVLHG